MPRYFFNIHDGQDIVDNEGTELRDQAEARCEAVNFAGACIAELGNAFWQSDEDGWSLQVSDEAGTPLFALKFAAVR